MSTQGDWPDNLDRSLESPSGDPTRRIHTRDPLTSHPPADDECPFRAIARGRQADEAFVIHRDATTSVVLSRHWRSQNPGHVLVVPVDQHENHYVLSDAVPPPIHQMAQRVSVALKRVYRCDGVTLLQNNEPAGGHNGWHYRLHVIPRWIDDGRHQTPPRLAPSRDPRRCAKAARNHFAMHPPNVG